MGSHEHFAGKRFATSDALKDKVLAYFGKLGADYCRAGLEKLVKWYTKCMDLSGDSMEK